ncbi:MAG TPA: PH domain-containing protein [Croceibacterium sp.]|nr:PH domain-containing protein [Croceibacterium sp.]
MSGSADTASGEWRRTSPLGFLLGAVMNLRHLLLPMVAAFFGTSAERAALYVVPVVLVGVGLTFLLSWVAWRHFHYQIGDSDIRVQRGLLSRTVRSVPYERIHDVTLEQALIPRLFGMVEVKFETGAGGKDELKIQYVTDAEGAALRETVRARKSSKTDTSEAEGVPSEGGSRVLFAMDDRRLLTFGLFEFSLIVFAVLAGATQQFDFLLPFEPWDPEAWMDWLAGSGDWLQAFGFAAQAIGVLLALATLGLVGLVTGLSRTVLRDYRFTLEETPKGLRRRRGLLTRTDVVMPIRRVQALKVTTGIVRRRFGWHGLSVVSLAQDAGAGHHVVIPFARMDEIAPVVEVTGFELPSADLVWQRPSLRHRLDRAALAVVPLAGAAAAAPALNTYLGLGMTAPLMASFAPLLVAIVAGARGYYLWRHDRHAVDARHIYVRRGWLSPKLDIASRIKLQSVEIVRGPLARRRGYADVKLGVAGGTLELVGVPVEEAQQIRVAVLNSITSLDFSRLAG